MNKTYCVDCQKEIEYEGFYCPIRCYACEAKQISSVSLKEWRYVNAKISISVPCVICGELVTLTESEEMVSQYNNVVKVCDKCKQAIMKMRETIEHEDKGE